MCSARCEAIGHEVTFGDQVLDRHMEVWKGRAPHPNDPFEALRPSRQVGSSWNMNLIVGPEMFVGDPEVPLIQPFLDEKADQALVLLG
jgi:hypothetical protein